MEIMAHSPEQIAEAQARLDRFAELVSLDIEIPQICQRMRIPRGSGYALMMKLRQKYGWQAA